MTINSSTSKVITLTVRLTPEQRKKLDQLAAGCTLSDYIRACIFSDQAPIVKTRGRFPVKDEQAVSRLLAMLGQSRIAQNINQLAKAVHSGSLPVNQDVQKQIMEACEAISWMRQQLLQALGKMKE
jgi:uncharacterized protein (DUF1778 family)